MLLLKMKTGKQKAGKHWNEMHDDLADKNGLAIIVVDKDSSVLSESNNNSMCRVLYNSEEFAPECAKFCGRAFEWATSAKKTVGYKCYAGLNCLAVPMKKKRKQAVAIVGRTFLKADDYRNATERAMTNDWQQFPPNEFFENVLLGNSQEDLDKLARQVEKVNEAEKESVSSSNKGLAEGTLTNGSKVDDKVRKPIVESRTNNGQPATNEAINPKSKIQNLRYPQWRSLLSSLLDLSYRQACVCVLKFVEQKYSISNLAWLDRRKNRLETLFAGGDLKDREMHLSISADDERLLNAAKKETPLELRERQTDEENEEKSKPQTIWLFPITIGGKIQSALIVGDKIEDENTERQIARFCQSVASELEILRLREQLSRRSWLERAVEKFNENLKNIDSEDFWSQLTNVSAELMRAERSSLLIFDEKSDTFTAKAATGIKADFVRKSKENLGERVAKNVLNGGAAVIVADIDKIGLSAAPKDWLYKSSSFISYPIAIDGRKIGVLNVTDKADGEVYNNYDLEILHAIVPQLAVLIDRASLKNKAVEFEQLSVTDALTGLLNRRYLEERVTEEIKRSNRHKFDMSFLMIDVDSFKSYNDNFGHTEGDKALQIVGICLKDSLRGADVAARYGGEEFSILLPQTTLEKAATIAERIRETVESTQFPNRQVTISIGVAGFSLNLNTAKKLISAADKALYAAKNRGRNNVQIYQSL